MMRFSAGILAIGLALPAFASAQSSSVSARAAAIAASFNKNKNAVKVKKGVLLEKYKRVENTPLALSDPRAYSGSYEAETLGYTLDLVVDSRGNVTGSGYQPLEIDGSVRRTFTLANGHIDGALFNATKVFENGTTQPVEGVFTNRTSYDSPTDRGHTVFGLGVKGQAIVMNQYIMDRFFFTKRN